MAWNPGQYMTYGALRTRPADELLARVPLRAPGLIYDLGCGPGNSTALLRARWPEARIVGVDSSPEMLSQARAEMGAAAQWLEADLGAWRAESPADLLYANASLHWLPGHEALCGRLMAMLAPGGALAVQMPRNFDAPSHRAIREAAADGPWAERLRDRIAPEPVAPPARYYDWLAPLSAELDIWETEYLQVLEGADPVLEWVKGTALRPLLAALDADSARAFEEACARRLAQAYPPRADGRTLFPFRRLFLVALRR